MLFIDFVQLASNVDTISPLRVCSGKQFQVAFTHCDPVYGSLQVVALLKLVSLVVYLTMYFTTEPSCVLILDKKLQ